MATTRTGAIIQICGTSWSPCGYCKGLRAHLSSMNDESDESLTSAHLKNAETTAAPSMGSSNIDIGNEDGINACSTSKVSTVSSACIYAIYAKSMSPAVYEELILNGWRRSGNSLYLPINSVSCCPSYPIRLHVNDFIPSASKSQRKLIKLIERILHPPQQTATTETTTNHTSASRTITKRKFDDPKCSVNPITQTGAKVATEKILFDTIQQTISMKELCQNTENAVQDTLRTISSLPSYSAESILLPCSWQIHYKPRPNGNRKSHSSSNNNPDLLATFTTSICAQLVGKSKGLIRDRKVFVQQTVTKLRDYYTLKMKVVDSNFSEKSNDKEGQEEVTSFVEIVSIDCHLESGQIVVQFQVNRLLYESTVINTNRMKDDPIIRNDTHDGGGNDRIRNWWTAFHNGRNRSMYFDKHDRHVTAMLSTSPLLPLQPTYEITVSTIPAHISALDPRVHQLYFLYQEIVHNEPNPLLGAVGTTTEQKLDVTDHSMLPENDDPTVDEQKERDVENKGSETEQLNIDWGQSGTPVGWKESAMNMLQQEYSDSDKKQSIYDAYGAFYEFLVENPFGQVTMSNKMQSSSSSFPNQVLPLGTFHQHYILCDVLIAVGVIDVLPSGLSSVYLFYHPSFAKDVIPMGKYAILQEIECTKQHRLPYYYLGYYIHSCPKMNYKSQYDPSEILCPITKQWVDVDQAKQMIVHSSPNHNYCKLVPNNTDHMDDAFAGAKKTATTTSKSQHQKSNDEVQVSVASAIENQIALQVGYEKPITLTMLNEPTQEILRPIIQDFIHYMGSNKDLAPKFIIDLVS